MSALSMNRAHRGIVAGTFSYRGWHTRFKKQPMSSAAYAQKRCDCLIARKLLRPSRGLRCPLIPIWEIVRYLATTSGHSAKEQERLMQLFYASLHTVHGEPSRGFERPLQRDSEIQC